MAFCHTHLWGLNHQILCFQTVCVSKSKMVQNYCLKLACFLSKYLGISLLDLVRETLSCPTKRPVTGYTLLLIYLSLNSPPKGPLPVKGKKDTS